MRAFALCICLVPVVCSADAFMCKRGNERIVSDRPCEQIGATHSKSIAGDASTPYQPDFHQQLNNVRQNRAELDARNSAGRPAPVAYEAPKPSKTAQCEQNWEQIRNVDAQLRVMSSEYWKSERVRLQDERWKLGC